MDALASRERDQKVSGGIWERPSKSTAAVLAGEAKRRQSLPVPRKEIEQPDAEGEQGRDGEDLRERGGEVMPGPATLFFSFL